MGRPPNAASEFSTLPPYYLMLTFWGEKYRNYFYSLCLPSLLSPNNLPLLQQVPGSKLIISTTSGDWAALRQTQLFQRLSTYVEPYFIDIGYPPPGVPIQLHMSEGHRRAARKAHEDRAFAGFLAPDLIVSDGLVRACMAHAASGKKIVLGQALRFAMEPVVDVLRKDGFMKPDTPMSLSPRFLGDLATKALHSEILRYDFENPYFQDCPIWSYWRVPGRACLVMHTVSWAVLLARYGTARYRDDFLQISTIDGLYVYRNFAHFRDTGEMHMITDSDEALFMSLTPEAEMSFPLVRGPFNRGDGIDHFKRLTSIQRFLSGDVVDPFRRWAYQVPTFIHGDDLDGDAARVASNSVAITTAAVAITPVAPAVRVPLSERSIRWIRSTLKAVAVELIIPLLRLLPRFYLRLALRVVPRRFVRSIVYRLAHRGEPLPRRLVRWALPALRTTAPPLIIPLLGMLPRFYLRLTLRFVPRPVVRSIVYRLAHRVKQEPLPRKLVYAMLKKVRQSRT